MYQELRSTGALSYDKVEAMFEEHQSKWPEAIFNEDSYFKYIQPFVENGDDYLEMLQGSKAEQRKWWLYNRFRYIDSKYNAGDSLTDYITIRGYAKTDITVKPYADIYPTVKYGSYIVQKRGKRNAETTLECPLSKVDDTEIYIYSASQLATIGDLSGFKPGLVNISMATRLQEFKVGDGDDLYSNGNLTSLTFGNNVLLKSIDVRNCPNLTGSVDIKGCTNVEEVYFEGSGITTIELPNGGILKKLHLPETVTGLVIMNQTMITDFSIVSYDNLTTVRLENVSSAIDPITIVSSVPSGSRIRLIGFYMEVDTVDEIDEFCDFLNTMRGLDENGGNTDTAQVQGTIHIPSITGSVLWKYYVNYPNITIEYDHITSYVYYYTYDGLTLLYSEVVTDEGDGTWDGSPARESTAQYDFTFAGWSTTIEGDVEEDATKTIIYDRVVYAAYTNTVRTYTVTWINTDETVLETDYNVPYGTTPTYDSETPTYGGYYADGWDPEVGPITGDTTYTATYLPIYTVWFYNGSTLLQTSKVKYGYDAVYTGDTPVDPDGEGAEFLGWARVYGTHTADDDALKNIISNTYIYAVFRADYEYPTSYDVSDAYGIEWNYGSGSLSLTRTGLAAEFTNPVPSTDISEEGSSPFDSIMPWAGMKRYNIINDEVSYSQDDSGFDEEAYDTVVYIPTFYYTAQKDKINGKWIWAISNTQKTGYCKHPGSGRYVGRFHTSGSSEEVYSKSGALPLVSTSQTNFRTYSHNKGDNWYMMDLATWSAIQMLYLVEYADFDAQLTLGTGYAGVNSELDNMGATGDAVYHTLKLSYAHNMYRWIEDPFSNCRDWVDGFLGNQSIVYTAYRDTGYTGSITGLNSTGFGLPASGYIAGFGYSEASAWAFIPDTAYVDAESGTTVDYVSSSPARCALFVGGDYDAYESYGFFFFYASIGAATTFSNLGSRLIYIP